jgi:hypothetical protein
MSVCIARDIACRKGATERLRFAAIVQQRRANAPQIPLFFEAISLREEPRSRAHRLARVLLFLRRRFAQNRLSASGRSKAVEVPSVPECRYCVQFFWGLARI